MNGPSDDYSDRETLRAKIIGLGEHSIRKSYYPALQERLAELERFRALLDQTRDAIFLIEAPTGRLIDVNESACKRLGFRRSELLFAASERLWSPPVVDAIGALCISSVSEDETLTIEAEMVTHTREHIPVETTLRRVHFHTSVYVVAVARDISERKQAEAALKESEEKYRLVVDRGSDLIVIAQEGKLKFVNARARDVTGYTEGELVQGDFARIISPPDRPTAREVYAKKLAGDSEPRAFSCRFTHKDGMLKWAEIKPVAISWEGKPALLCFISDVTVERTMEEELLRMQKLDSLGILAGGIAHDFNNILTAILGNISVARVNLSLGTTETLGRRLAEAEKACLAAQGLTQQLLTFSKGGAPVKRLCDLGSLVREASSFALRGSNVRPEFAVQHDLWPVNADSGQIGQVINNLVINADHAMPEGGAIVISATNLIVTPQHSLPIEDGPYVCITFQDFGVGIPPAYLQKIFDPYFTTKQKGSGLGLTTSYSIIKNHGGFLTVRSEVGVGSVFEVYLAARPGEVAPGQEAEGSLQGGEGRVLFMDDEEMIRDVVGEMISLLGYDVVLAKDGSEVIELYTAALDSSAPFDAVVMDLTVPGGMGGREAMKILLEGDPEIRAVATSGYSTDPVMQDYRAYGFSGVLVKPFNVKELGDALRDVVYGERK
ncbi:MAG: PAS domain S-box protein [Pseudomonadota bacterium]